MDTTKVTEAAAKAAEIAAKAPTEFYGTVFREVFDALLRPEPTSWAYLPEPPTTPVDTTAGA